MNDDGGMPPSVTIIKCQPMPLFPPKFLRGGVSLKKYPDLPPVAGFNRVSDLGAGRMGIARDYSSLFVIITRCLGADVVVNFRHACAS